MVEGSETGTYRTLLTHLSDSGGKLRVRIYFTTHNSLHVRCWSVAEDLQVRARLRGRISGLLKSRMVYVVENITSICALFDIAYVELMLLGLV